jgi:sarcosine oxidase
MNPNHPTWYKVALHGRNDLVMDEKQIGEKNAARPVSPEELEELKSAVAQWISCAPDRFVHAIPCTYTSTDDGHFIVDSVYRHDNTIGSTLLCVAGLSGHGFKMVPALGKAVADLAMDGVTSLPIKFLGLDRFKKE